MRDLLIITPTRGRPGNAERLARAAADTCTAETDLIFAIDEDDPSYAAADLGDALTVCGPRRTCPAWSNTIAAEHAPRYRALASLGDDHLPRTPGWDTTMLAALDDLGDAGIVYGDDIGQGANLPTAPVMTSNIPVALGWMFLPGCQHLFCDNAWLDLGREANCLKYLPGVVIEHLHYSRGAAPDDATYQETRGTWPHDEHAYLQWRRNQLGTDAAKIRKLRGTGGWGGAPR